MVCDFSKVAFSIFGLRIHWYSLAYIFGILVALHITKKNLQKTKNNMQVSIVDNFLSWAIFGIIIGGRLGYVIFYDLDYFLSFPIEIFKIWRGGMSFYGGFIGVLVSAYVFCKKYEVDFFRFMDLWSVGAPIGLFFGRVANFINGELLGKESNVAWAVIFKDGVSRHPSQLYEAFAEGILLFVIMHCAFRMKYYKYSRRLSGVFCVGYASARFYAEFFREPDSLFSWQLYFSTGINLNQYMSSVLFLLGITLLFTSKKYE